MVARGVAGARAIPSWDIFRFDGDVLHREDGPEDGGLALEVMFVDVDGDGALDLLWRGVEHVHCYYCGLASVFFGLHRWNGTEIVWAPLAELPAGADLRAAQSSCSVYGTLFE